MSLSAVPSTTPAPAPLTLVGPRRDPAVALDVGDQLEKVVIDRFAKGAQTLQVPAAGDWQAYKSLVATTQKALRSANPEGLEQARTAANRLGCELVAQDGCLMLRDQMGHERGWGTVIFNIHPSTGLIIEVPHPGFDWSTPELGWRFFKAFNADACVVAGAHRGNRMEPSPDVPAAASSATDSDHYEPWQHAPGVPDYSISDPSHSSVLPFEAAHEALVTPGCTVLQVHGFSAASHHKMDARFPADQQVVLTHCAADHVNPPTEVAMDKALQGAGFKTWMVDFSDDAHSTLGAVVNVQHAYLQRQGLVGPGLPTQFVHVEFDTSLRKGPQRDANFDALVKALTPVFQAAPGESPHT